MMMGAGLLFMLLIPLIVIGVPLLRVVLLVGGGLTALLRSLSNNPKPPAPPPVATPTPARACPTCGREIRPGWNVCPSCGAALT
ncbi:MAG: zinc ribbon domain-containing protein [Chloroflexi bacterium]|nr:zinc ribbon domain-containing protein [Chloroflexota bacterium]